MAAVTGRTELALVNIEMAVRTLGGIRHILIVHMALVTIHFIVAPDQWELCLNIMLKAGHRGPSRGVMTDITGLAELILVKVEVTICTGRLDGLEVPIRMAACTGY